MPLRHFIESIFHLYCLLPLLVIRYIRYYVITSLLIGHTSSLSFFSYHYWSATLRHCIRSYDITLDEIDYAADAAAWLFSPPPLRHYYFSFFAIFFATPLFSPSFFHYFLRLLLRYFFFIFSLIIFFRRFIISYAFSITFFLLHFLSFRCHYFH